MCWAGRFGGRRQLVVRYPADRNVTGLDSCNDIWLGILFAFIKSSTGIAIPALIEIPHHNR